MSRSIGLVIVGAGQGLRLGNIEKCALKLKNKPLIYWNLKAFEGFAQIKQVVLVVGKKHFSLAKRSADKFSFKKVSVVEGGAQRKDSTFNGLTVLDKNIDQVLIHDCARPFVSKKIIKDLIESLRKYPAVICGINSPDTLKLQQGNFIKATLDRKKVVLAQTPQGFKKDLILKAYAKFGRRNFTDEAQLMELFGKKVKIVAGDSLNFKITYPQDLIKAKAIIG